MPEEDKEQFSKLLGLIDEAIKQDQALREKYQVGDKFRFIRDRLQSLLEEVKLGPQVVKMNAPTETEKVLGDDEALVYVHLYNAQGLSFRSWQSIINPKAFFDFSVNRPIYQEKAAIDEFIRGKSNKAQHGYLVIAVKKEKVMKPLEDLKDAMGHALLKVKEGSLQPDRLWSFHHNEQEYLLSEDGSLVRKS